MNEIQIQVKATREGGETQRAHGTFHHTPYSVASHSYGAVSLLLLLHPNPSLDLVKALQWHDVAERWLGDIPSPAKRDNPGLREVYESVETEYLNALGFNPKLTREDREWVRALDVLELWLWAREEVSRGNIPMTGWVDGVGRALDQLFLGGELPFPVRAFYLEESVTPAQRLSDRFSDVRTNLVILRYGSRTTEG